MRLVRGKWRYSYWGNGIPTDKRFSSQQREYETEPPNQWNAIYHYGARLYNADIGRFISADTIVPQPGNPQALNRYSYALNNPLRYTDPTGNYFVDSGGDRMDIDPSPYVYTPEQVYSAVDWVGQESLFRQGGPCHGASTNFPGAGLCNAMQGLWMEQTYKAAMLLRHVMDINGLRWTFEQRDFLRQMPWLFGPIDQTSPPAGVALGAVGVIAVGSIGSSAASSLTTGVHGNSFASTKTTYLYQLVDKTTGEHLKWGITPTHPLLQCLHVKQANAYSLLRTAQMFAAERWLSERLSGKLNFEPWAGAFRGRFPFFPGDGIRR